MAESPFGIYFVSPFLWALFHIHKYLLRMVFWFFFFFFFVFIFFISVNMDYGGVVWAIVHIKIESWLQIHVSIVTSLHCSLRSISISILPSFTFSYAFIYLLSSSNGYAIELETATQHFFLILHICLTLTRHSRLDIVSPRRRRTSRKRAWMHSTYSYGIQLWNSADEYASPGSENTSHITKDSIKRNYLKYSYFI